jgi:prefoldin subunit 5
MKPELKERLARIHSLYQQMRDEMDYLDENLGTLTENASEEREIDKALTLVRTRFSFGTISELLWLE